MYVALTRARRRLYLSFAQTRLLHGQTRYNMASRFIEEIPSGLLKWLTPKINKSALRGSWSDSGADSYRPSAKAQSGIGFRIGQSVKHAKFGSGVIVNAEGGGNDARVQVNFGGGGMKWLALSVAKLEPA